MAARALNCEEFMGQQPTTMRPAQGTDVAREEWNAFMARFTRENRGAHAEVEVLGLDVGHYVPLENRPFDGIAADVKDGENVVWMMFGQDPDDRLTHGIQQVTAIRVRPPVGAAGAALEVDSNDGTRTLLELSRPEAYELPPASNDWGNRK
jgi:hypothetical protein